MKKNKNFNTLTFSKNALVELNDHQLAATESGFTPLASSNICWAIGGYITGEIIEGIYQYTQNDDCGCNN